MKINLIYQTLRKLSISQIYHRINFLFKKKFNVYQNFYLNKRVKVFHDTKNIKYDVVNRNYSCDNELDFKIDVIDDIIKNKFIFLNHKIDFGEQINWSLSENESKSRLWSFHLHYFDYLVDIAKLYIIKSDKKYYQYIKKTLLHWNSHNSLKDKNFDYAAWSRYVVSCRLISLIRVYALLKNSNLSDKPFFIFLRKLIIKHVLYLKDNLELDILGNHIIKNYKALVFASILFDDKELHFLTEKIYKKYISNQFTSKSGMHKEFSPMYSSIVLEDLLDIYNLNRDKKLEHVISKLLHCIDCLNENDKLFYFNDCVDSFAKPFSYLKTFANKLGISYEKIKKINDLDGLIVFSSCEKNNIKFGINCANIPIQDGHYHCSNLSLELFYKNLKFLTNSGVLGYSNNLNRNSFRSTSYHNTLQFGTFEQSQIWALFRVGKRAKSSYVISNDDTRNLLLRSNVVHYNGIVHKRTVELDNMNYKLNILDQVNSDKDTSCVYYHIHPKCIIKKLSKNSLEISRENGKIRLNINEDFEIIETPFAEEFGKKQNQKTIFIRKSSSCKSIKTILTFE